MRKWIALALVLALLAGGALLVLSNLDSYLDQNREWLAAEAEARLGRGVAVGEIGVSLSGGLGAELHDLRIADDPAFAADDFLRVDRAYVLIDILPALAGRYQVRRVVLERPRLTLIRSASGFNFDSFARRPLAARGAPGDPASGAPKPPPAGSAAALPLLVAQLSIRDASIRYVDRSESPPLDLTITDLDVEIAHPGADTPIEIEAGAVLPGAEGKTLAASGTIGPLVAADPGATPLDLSLDLGPIVLDRMKNAAPLAAALPEQLRSADPIRLHAAIAGTLARPEIAASLDASEAAIEYGALFRKAAAAPLEVAVQAARRGEAIEVASLTAKLGALALHGTGRIVTTAPMQADFAIEAPAASLSAWADLVPGLGRFDLSGRVAARVQATAGRDAPPQLDGTIELADAAVRRRADGLGLEGLSTAIRLQGNEAVLPPSEMRLAGVPLRLQATVKNFARPAIEFRADAAELRPAALREAKEESGREEVLREVSFGGVAQLGAEHPGLLASITSAAGTWRAIDYRNLRATVSLQNEVVLLRRFEVETLDGSLALRGQYDRGQQPPALECRTTVRDLEVAALLAAWDGAAKPAVRGRLQAELNLRAAGEDAEAIRASLTGDGNVRLRDGTLEDFNLAEGVLGGLTGIRGLSQLVSPRVRDRHPEIFSTGSTRFEALAATVAIADRRASTNDLTIEARDYAVRAAGSVGFDQRVDLKARFVASEKLTADVLSGVEEARLLANEKGRLEIPFRLKGTLPGVRPKPDGPFIARALQRALLGGGLERLLGGKKDEERDAPPVDELIDKGLKKLFGAD